MISICLSGDQAELSCSRSELPAVPTSILHTEFERAMVCNSMRYVNSLGSNLIITNLNVGNYFGGKQFLLKRIYVDIANKNPKCQLKFWPKFISRGNYTRKCNFLKPVFLHEIQKISCYAWVFGVVACGKEAIITHLVGLDSACLHRFEERRCKC